jgi:acyl-CoA synthetase (AMP-forming)/AMP-acid ligase II
MELDPTVPAVRYGGTWWTWGDLSSVADGVEAHVEQLALEVPIAVVTRNRPAIVGTMLGLLARHRPILTLNGMHPTLALCDELEKLRPRVVVASDEDWERTEFAAAVAAVGALGLAAPADLVGVRVVVEAADAQPGALDSLGDDVAVSLQTSGTTGPPKRIAMTYANITASVTSVLSHYSNATEEVEPALREGVSVQMLPLGHTSALLSLCMLGVEGRRIVLLDRFEPRAWAEAVRDYKIAVSGMPPAAIRMVLDSGIPPEWLVSLRAVRAGTAPLDPSLAAEFEETFGTPVIQAYGATEFQGVASWTLRDYRKYRDEKKGSVGRAHPGVELRTVDVDTGEATPPGRPGVLEVRSAQSAGSSSTEWVRTSDLARLDVDGFLWIDGRVDDVINRGGFKVDGNEVATVLAEHPLVEEAVVVGAPDRRLGSVPVALAVPVGGNGIGPTEEELRQWVRDRLEPYKVPVRIVLIEQLPLNATMKVGRNDVLELVSWNDGD